MKKFTVMMIFVGIWFVSAVQAMAEGNCDRLIAGNDGSWRSYDAVNEYVEVRTCVSPGSNFNHIDIRNPLNYTICVTARSEKEGERWPKLPVGPGKVISCTSSYGDEIWHIVARKMEGKFCK
jgi:hypothetical protein